MESSGERREADPSWQPVHAPHCSYRCPVGAGMYTYACVHACKLEIVGLNPTQGSSLKLADWLSFCIALSFTCISQVIVVQ